MIDTLQLKAKIDAWLAQAPLAAQELGLTIEGLADAIRARVDAINEALRKFDKRLGRTAESIYRFIVGRSAQASAIPKRQPTPASLRARAPLGLRSRLHAQPAHVAALKRGRIERLTAARARAAVHAVIRPAVPSRVGPLLVSRSGRSRTVTVAAVALTSPTVALTVVGPGYAGEVPLATRDGVAAARFKLPARRGLYRIGIADLGAPQRARIAVAHIRLRS